MSSISVDALNILAYLSSKGKGRAWVYANCKKGSVLPDELSDRRDEISSILEYNKSGFDGIITFYDSIFPKIRAHVSAGDYLQLHKQHCVGLQFPVGFSGSYADQVRGEAAAQA